MNKIINGIAAAPDKYGVFRLYRAYYNYNFKSVVCVSKNTPECGEPMRESGLFFPFEDGEDGIIKSEKEARKYAKHKNKTAKDKHEHY